MKKILCILLALVTLTVFAACGDKAEKPSDDLSKILDKGEMVIGITVYDPMNFYDESGELVGFDTEFSNALCEKLGVTPKFEIINWDSKEVELSSGNIDCIWNGLTVNDERRENMDFTLSYLRNEQVVVVRAENAELYTDAASLSGKTVVAEEGSAGAAAVEHDLPDAVFTGVAAQTTALMEVKAGTAEAAVIDYTMARSMTGSGEYTDLVIISSIQMMPEEYAIGLRLGSSAVSKFNEIINELYEDGTLSEIAVTYDLTDLLIEQ